MKQSYKIILLAIALVINYRLTANNDPKLPEGFKPKTTNGAGAEQSQNISFTENKGQVMGYDQSLHPEVKYSFQQAGTQIFLLEKGIAYQFTKVHQPKGYSELMRDKSATKDFEKLQKMQKDIRVETFRMDMSLVGANSNAEITREGKSEDYTNFYNLNVLDVYSFSKITYHDIYPGIDWVVYANEQSIKYDFVLHPGANTSQIKMQFMHQEGLKINKDGSLTLKNRLGEITEKTPVSFQNNKTINTKFILKNDIVTFDLDSYSKSQVLTIDPNLVWATYYGGTGQEDGLSCSTDNLGNIYMGGWATSTSNIASGGYQNIHAGGLVDAFLVKFNNSGVRQWATYYGGGGDDRGESCATDSFGNVYLGGWTTSTASIASVGHQNTYGGGYYDAFLVKFNSAGSRQWATYYGGTDYDVSYSCTTDALGNVYLSGSATSTANIASSGHQNIYGGGYNDAFLVKFNSSGVRQWGTYCGGFGNDGGSGCAIDASGNVYLAGSTDSFTYIASSGHQNTLGGGLSDAFLVKFNSAGIRLWGTYYGGTNTDEGYGGCATDAANNVYLCGHTSSTANIASGGHQNVFGGGSVNGFLAKFNSSGVRQWGTYYGNNPGTAVNGCATDNSNNIYIVGNTGATSNIAVNGYQNSSGGGMEAYLVKFNAFGVIQWGTYYGSSGSEVGNSCISDALGNIYLSGFTSSSAGISFGGYQNSNGGGSNEDAFLAQFSECPPKAPINITSPTNQTLCINNSATISAIGNGTVSWFVSPGSTVVLGTGSAFTTPTLAAGTYSYYAETFACAQTSSRTIVTVTVNALPLISAGSGSICVGQIFTINPSGASTYTYSGGSATVAPINTSTYSIIGTSSLGCISSNTVITTVSVAPLPTISVNSGSICFGTTFTLSPSGASSYTYSGGSVLVSPPTNTTYAVTGTSSLGCVSSNTAIASITVATLPTVSVNSGTICSGTAFVILPSGANTYTIQGGTTTVSPMSASSYTVRGTDLNGCISANTATSNVTVNITPTVSVSSGSICAGNSFVIVPSGASSYTYSSGTATVSPNLTTTYSVTGTSSVGCVSGNTAIATISVAPLPTLSVNSGSFCLGSPFVIVPSGASTYTISGGTATVSPANTNSYSVSGTSSVGCLSSNTVIATASVVPLPTLSVNSGSICSGSSFVIVPTGAVTYTFSSGSATVSPLTTTSYSVSGTSSLGCVSSSSAICSVSVSPNPTLSINSGSVCLGNSFVINPSGANTYTFSGGSSTVNPGTTTSYSVTGTSLQGCLSSNTAVSTITVISLPTLSVQSTNSLICEGETATLSVSGAISYSWNNGSNLNLITVSPTLSTSYTVTGVNLNGCAKTEVFTQNVNPCASINQLNSFNNQLLIYPNPNNGEFTIDTLSETDITIINAIGQVIKQQHLSEGKNTIDLNEQAKGIYFLKLGGKAKLVIKE